MGVSVDELEQGSGDDTGKVSHANKESPSSEASDSVVNASTLASNSSYSGYPTNECLVSVNGILI